jgi:hypothetical protein
LGSALGLMPNVTVIEEIFRRLVLMGLHRRERLSEEFRDNLLGWVRSGFSVTTPLDPRTGQNELVLDPLEWIHQVVQQIPAARQHLVRYYGACANRRRRRLRQAAERGEGTPPGRPAEEELAFHRPRPSWAPLLRRIFETDPLLCPQYRTEMKVIRVITEPEVIDQILKHIARTGGRDPFEGRGPPEGEGDPAEKEAGAA